MAETDELSLDEVLGEKPEATEEVEETEATTEVAEEAETSTEATETAAETEETDAEESATPADEEKDQSWHLKAVLDEREKRQAAQRKAEELQAKLDALTKGEEPSRTSIFDDEGKFRSELLSDVERTELNSRLNISQGLAEDKWGEAKVSESMAKFRELVKENPGLWDEIKDAPLPYFKLVRIVERHDRAKEIEALTSEDYETKLRAKIRAEVEAELKGKQDADKQKRESITPSLASKRSTGGVKASGSLIGLDDVMPD